MHRLTFDELLKATLLTENLLKQWRNRDQIAFAFGRSDAYKSLAYLDLDVLAVVLTDKLAQQLGRDLAARIVRDLWGVWMRVVAQAEAAPNKPALFYVCEYKDARGKRQHITLGSTLDPDQPGALAAIAIDIRARTGVTLHSYVVADITDILRDVRAAAKAQGFDFSAAFLPPLGDSRLDEILQPYDDAMPDRAVVVSKGDARRVARAGDKARGKFAAMVEGNATVN